MSNQTRVSVYKGTSKKSGQSFRALKVEVGKISKLYFDLDEVQLDYVESILDGCTKDKADDFFSEEDN